MEETSVTIKAQAVAECSQTANGSRGWVPTHSAPDLWESSGGLPGSLHTPSSFDEPLQVLASIPHLTGDTSASYSSHRRKTRHTESGGFEATPLQRVCRCVRRCHDLFNLRLGWGTYGAPNPTLKIKKPLGEGIWACVLMLVFCLGAGANELPETPLPKPIQLERPIRFWDKPNKIEFASMFTMASFDMAQTCHIIANGGKEDFLPAKNCAGVVGMIAAGEFAAVGAAWLLHKTHHHKLERLPMLVMIQADIRGIWYSHTHGSF